MSLTTILLILLVLAVCSGGGLYGFRTWGPYYGGGIGLGGIVVILLVLYLLGFI